MTNVLARLELEGEGAPRTAVVIQSTRLPEAEVAAGEGFLLVRLPGFALNMPPDRIPVQDGLVRDLEVSADDEGCRVRITLEHGAPWSVARRPGWPAETAVLVSHAPLLHILGGRTVIVDPAHGGRDAGARGPVNLVEKNVVLDVARRLARHLEAVGAQPLLTRGEDRALREEERLAAAARARACCLIRLHTGHEGSRVRGFRTLFSLRSPGSRDLALAVHRRLKARLPLPERGCLPLPSRQRLPAPTVVVEVVNLAHPLDEALLRDAVFKERVARAILAGIKDFLAAGTAPPPEGSDPAPPRSEAAVELPQPEPASGWRALPLRTHLLAPGEDVVEVVRRYAVPISQPGDVVCLSESALAVVQGRAVPSDEVSPCLLARLLCRLPDPEGSLATPQAMHLAIAEVGALRVLAGVAAAGLGRLAGRRGDFYRVAGRSLAQIDDIAGTLPPYDRCIVLGPCDPEAVVRSIRGATGLEACVTDANDLGRVDLLAATDGVDRAAVAAALRRNPHGNGDERTPLVLLRRL